MKGVFTCRGCSSPRDLILMYKVKWENWVHIKGVHISEVVTMKGSALFEGIGCPDIP